jgi:hypothetical protein
MCCCEVMDSCTFGPTQRTKQCLSPLIVRSYARIFVRLEMSGGPRGQEFNIRKCRHTIGLNNYRQADVTVQEPPGADRMTRTGCPIDPAQ